LFVVSGAFDGLEKITRKRLREATIGFAAREREPDGAEKTLELAQTRDFIEFGFEPEFIGRLPVRVLCRTLQVDDLHQILKSSEGSIVRQYEQTFAAYGLEVLFKDDALRRIAEMAAEEKTGARGLMTICERVFREFKFELPSTQVRRFEVDRATVDQPAQTLARLLQEQAVANQGIGGQLVVEFAERFAQAHGITLQFTPAASARLVTLAAQKEQSVRDLCSELFKDYQFGLKLIVQNTGRTQFTLDVDAVEAPEKVLSDWVVASYQPAPESNNTGAAEAGPPLPPGMKA
jgi:GNAT superfamily N-acetyltransferase